MNKSKIVLYAACVFASLVQGWIILKFYAVGVWLMYFGIVGAIPFLLVNGVHGDTGVFGGILYVLTNGAVYYGIVSLVLKLRRRRLDSRLKSAEFAK